MSLWPHQQRVFDMLAEGHNVILQAPTGSGKTRAALYPFLYSMDTFASQQLLALPRKCIYSVPMRVLANQFALEYKQTVKAYNARFGLDITTSIQTGDQATDRELTANLIFATIDQTLSSFLVSPYSLSKRKANLNAGAVTGAYLVFDEFHLYGPEMLQTTLQMLRMLRDITPFTLMTATFSSEMLHALGKKLNAQIIPGTTEERNTLNRLESQQKTRRYIVSAVPLSAAAVLAAHSGRSLVISNRVNRAQSLFQEIQRAAPPDTQVFLLHSRFLSNDRRETEDQIRALFGKDSTAGDYIVVATQAIEVGLDITSTALHTELAPANALIQRAGRCARYAGETGQVYIYPQVSTGGEDIELLENTAPYMGQEGLFPLTLDAFRQYSGQSLNFTEEQAILSAVHNASDRALIEALDSQERQHQRNMFAVMRGDDNNASSLIRNVMQQQVTIHPEPDDLLESPFDVPAFGLHRGTMQGYIRSWLEAGNALDLPWSVKWLHQSPDTDESNRTVYRWQQVYDTAKEALGAPLIVVHPALATYHPEIGFLPQRDQHPEWIAPQQKSSQHRENVAQRYRLETYEQHISHVHRAFTELWPELNFAAHRLEARFGWQPDTIYHAAELAVLLHDVGKLSRGWQKWAHAYQQAVSDYEHDISLQPIPDEAYAHTTADGDRYRELEASIHPRRPTHAVESAIAAAQTVAQTLNNDDLTLAVLSAIMRHHAPHSNENQAFRLVRNAAQHVQAALTVDISVQLLGLDGEIPRGNDVRAIIAEPEQEAAFLTYLLIVRALRRADQIGTQRGANGG